jgi:NhaA family Na+:H+ antiporter
VGISAFSWIGVRLGLGRLPAGVDWRQLMGAAWLAGIGFTMSLFIAQLAFAQPEQVESAKLGILIASCVAAALGIAWLWTPARR